MSGNYKVCIYVYTKFFASSGTRVTQVIASDGLDDPQCLFIEKTASNKLKSHFNTLVSTENSMKKIYMIVIVNSSAVVSWLATLKSIK